MQDGASGHVAKEIRQLSSGYAINVLGSPPCSPNLNAIETLWKYMKGHLTRKYRDYQFESYDVPRAKVQDGWDQVVTSGVL